MRDTWSVHPHPPLPQRTTSILHTMDESICTPAFFMWDRIPACSGLTPAMRQHSVPHEPDSGSLESTRHGGIIAYLEATVSVVYLTGTVTSRYAMPYYFHPSTPLAFTPRFDSCIYIFS
jgi:hypothetical protein